MLIFALVVVVGVLWAAWRVFSVGNQYELTVQSGGPNLLNVDASGLITNDGPYKGMQTNLNESRCPVCNGWRRDPADPMLPCPQCGSGRRLIDAINGIEPHQKQREFMESEGPYRMAGAPLNVISLQDTANALMAQQEFKGEPTASTASCAARRRADTSILTLSRVNPAQVGRIALRAERATGIEREAAKFFIAREAMDDKSKYRLETQRKYGVAARTLRRWVAEIR